MATELRPSFPVLEDVTTQAGTAWHMGKEGDPSATRNAAPALVAVDSSLDLQYLRVNGTGELLVSTAGDIACLSAQGTNDDGGALALVCEITLQASKVYKDLETIVSSYRNAKFLVEWVDDEGGGGEAITTLFKGRVGPGSLTECCRLVCAEFTSGAVGVQKLRIRAESSNGNSDIDGALAVSEVQ